MTNINWDRPYFDFFGISSPTYGLNGGPNYTLGEVGGSTLENGHPVRPEFVSQLDRLYFFHDRAYDFNPNAVVLPEADLKLVLSIYHLSDHQLADPEDSLFAGVSELAFLYQLSTAGALPSAIVVAAITADALENIVRGLAGLEGAELTKSVALLDQFANLIGVDLPFSAPSDALDFVQTTSDSLPATVDVLSLVAEHRTLPDHAIQAIGDHAPPQEVPPAERPVSFHPNNATHDHGHWLL